MSNDKEIREFFSSHKADFPDNEFSRRVISNLPGSGNVMLPLIVALFSLLGVGLTVGLYGLPLFLNQINDLVVSVSKLEMPSLSSIMAYIMVLWSMAVTGFAVYKAN